MQSFHAEICQMTAIRGPSRLSIVEVQGPDPGWIETLFYRLRNLVVENAFDNALAETPSFLAMLACERLELRSVVRSTDSRIFCWLPLFRRATFVAPAAAMVPTQGTLSSTSETMATNFGIALLR